MISENPHIQRLGRRTRIIPVSGGDAPYLGATLLVGLAVATLYIALNTYPGYGAGLYTLAADTIRANGYALPASIPHYSPEGVPFAYPPFVFYALAVLRDLGAPTFQTALVLPPLLTVAHLVPIYLLGRDLFGRRLAGVAAGLLFILNPQVIEWHITAGGLVRATAFLFALSSIYAALRIFRDLDPGWIPFGLTTFTLVVLTHPTYTLFTVVSYLLLYVGYDRTVVGLVRGAIVGLGGVVLTAPWWGTVASMHGPTIFAAAAGTHGGIGGGLGVLLEHGLEPTLLPIAAGAIMLLDRRYALAAWPLVTWLLFKQPRFTYAVGALTAVGAAITIGARIDSWRDLHPSRRRTLAVTALLVLATVGVGTMAYEFAGQYDDTTPEFVDEESVAAMEWAAAEAPEDASFVVLGDGAEWFPVVADRTIGVSPWGMEWREPEAYYGHLEAFREASTCQSVGCVEAQIATVDADPDYIYVPKESYTVRGAQVTNFGTLDRSFAASEDYRVVFENEGVVIYRAVDGA